MRTTGPGAVSAFNPVYAVELEPEETPEGQRWSPAEAARFLAATAADPLGLMFCSASSSCADSAAARRSPEDP
jgi:hypothetical protein